MNYFCLSVDFTVTLMRIIEEGFHVQSGDKIFRYYFRVPETFVADLQENAYNVAKEMYLDLAEQFRLAEPNDPNYITVLKTNAAILTAEEVSQKNWFLTETAVWESSPCVIVNEDFDYRKIDPEVFGMFFS